MLPDPPGCPVRERVSTLPAVAQYWRIGGPEGPRTLIGGPSGREALLIAVTNPPLISLFFASRSLTGRLLRDFTGFFILASLLARDASRMARHDYGSCSDSARGCLRPATAC